MTANNEHRFGNAWPDDEIAMSPQEIQKAADALLAAESYLMSGEEQSLVETFNLENLDPKLDTPETTSTFSAKHTYRGRFMAGKEQEYEVTLAAYRIIYPVDHNSHVQALEGCRTYASLRRESATGDLKVFGDSCRDRWCPMCAGQKMAYAKDQCEIYLRSLKKPRFLTLTLRHNESDLKTQISYLQESFARLRSRAYWKKNVTGGIWFLQVKRGKNSGLWHPHFHILLDGNYMERGKLSQLWDLVTYGSPIIDIQQISDIDDAAKYVARYVSRPAWLSDMPEDDRVEVIEALFRKRLSGTFGTGKTVTLTPPKIESDDNWEYIGHYDDIAQRAEYSETAKAIMVAYNTYQPLSEKVFEDFTGHAPGDLSVFEPPPPKAKQLLLDFYNS